MIKLLKNLWNCFVLGKKGPNHKCYTNCCEESVDSLLEAEDLMAEQRAKVLIKQQEHYKDLYDTLNSRAKKVLDDNPNITYSTIMYTTVEDFKSFKGCGQKTAEHIHAKVKEYIISFDNDMIYTKTNGGDSEFDSL